ncbi:methyl-accepting chemotaxis protein [Synergistales bacterium]|nr:methyl-accepting chemotaxis protein [Synergistales bacterium]
MFARLKIGPRIFIVSFFLVLMGVAVSSFIAGGQFVKTMQTQMDRTLDVATDGAASEVESIVSKMKTLADALSANTDIPRHIEDSLTNNLNRELLPYLKVSGLDTLTVTDSNGIVLSRPHAQSRIGDSVAKKGYIAPALTGGTSLVLESGTTIALGLFYGFPVKSANGKVIGAIAIGFNIGNPAMADKLKAMYQADITVYYGDKAASTTLMRDGERMLDTVPPPELLDVVVKQGKNTHRFDDILDVTYRTAYRPFVFNGQNVGMLAGGLSTENLESTIKETALEIALSCLGVMIFAVALTYFFTRSISNPMDKLVELMERLRKGDLTMTDHDFMYKRSDEIGEIFDALQATVESQSEYIMTIKDSSARVSDGSHDLAELSLASNHTVDSMKHSAAELSSISASTNESVQRASGALRNIAELSSNVSGTAENGAKIMNDVSKQINSSADRVQEALDEIGNVMRMVNENNEQIKSLGESINEITGFISVITGIADQTNLLALNAAIEAARAGESGRGFAVVAEEVRKLAEDSSQSAKRISEVIDPIRNAAQTVMDSALRSVSILEQTMEEASSAKSELLSSTESMNSANKLMQQIVSVVEEQTSSVQEVSGMTEELAHNMEGLARDIGDINDEASDTLKSAAGVSKTAESMRELAVTLNESLSHFKIRDAIGG